MSDLYNRIYQVVQCIPPGRVTNYGAIARYVGSPQGSRMVGWALKQCHTYSGYVPAHRVVNRMGCLSGKHRFPGGEIMKELLESEGLVVVGDQVQNFEQVYWDPSKELGEGFI